MPNRAQNPDAFSSSLIPAHQMRPRLGLRPLFGHLDLGLAQGLQPAGRREHPSAQTIEDPTRSASEASSTQIAAAGGQIRWRS
jgi:hypothetical protein